MHASGHRGTQTVRKEGLSILRRLEAGVYMEWGIPTEMKGHFLYHI